MLDRYKFCQLREQFNAKFWHHKISVYDLHSSTKALEAFYILQMCTHPHLNSVNQFCIRTH